MMKRFFALLLALMLCLCMALPAFAADTLTLQDESSLLVDDAELLTDEEEASVLEILETTSNSVDADIVIYMTDSLEGETIEDFADMVYDGGGYGRGEEYDGALMLLSMETNEVYIMTCGNLYETVDSQQLLNAVLPELNEGDCYSACTSFVYTIEEALLEPTISSKSDEGVDADYEPISRLLYDGADILSLQEEASLAELLEAKSDSANADIIVYTVNSLYGEDPESFAQRVYIENNYGRGDTYDGVMVLLAMQSRDVYVLTDGLAEKKINESSLRQKITPDLSSGDYYSAFKTFANKAEDSMNAPLVSFGFIPISLGIGFLVSLIITSSMKSKMKSVRMKADATGYVRSNSMVINQSEDRFLYMHLDRVPRPKQTTSSGGSRSSGGGGHSFGGSGGKF